MRHWFNRFLLPAFAFKAVIIGGGYATGRELAEFFLPYGPRGGLLAMLVSAVIWSIVCAITLNFAVMTGSHDYRAFFKQLLGPLAPVFEISYVLCAVLVLSVFAAATGEMGAAMFAWPRWAGALLLLSCIAVLVSHGNKSVEAVFKYVSFFLYAVYVLFLILALSSFGGRIVDSFSNVNIHSGWISGTVRYSGYNLVGAVLILSVLRHITSRRDATIAGLLCGPLAMLPAILFFIAMAAYYPEIGKDPLPSNFLLSRMNMPLFRIIFQTMIFAAMLESATGIVHAINERIAAQLIARGRAFPPRLRFGVAVTILVFSTYIAGSFGLIRLISKGYSALAYLFVAVYLLPLLTVGLWRVLRTSGLSLSA